MIKKLYVFANMGHLNELPKSGGQSSARRVMKGLQESGFEIVPIRRHRSEWEGRRKHQVEVLLFALIDSCKIVWKMLFGCRRNSMFLHLTYAGPLVPFELFLSALMVLMRYKRITYIKGGQILDYFANASKIHRWMFKRNMDLQQLVMAEGEATIDVVKSVSNVKTVYFPNYVFDELIPEDVPEKPKDVINLCYFGRIGPDKNIHIILDAFELLCQKYKNMHLTLIGGKGKSQAYVDSIDRKISSSPYRDRITRKGISSQDYIREVLKGQHFFLFPSKEKAEGHSNSLTEAMSYGVVPVVSDWHFNKAIVGDSRMVVTSFNATDYAERISNLINDKNFESMSRKVWLRIKSMYSYSIVNKEITANISELLCKQ